MAILKDWRDIRIDLLEFAEEFSDATDERRESQTFWNHFFRCFGINRRRVGLYEKAVKKLDGANGFIDMLWPGRLAIEQKSRGKNLEAAMQQAVDYLHGLEDVDLPEYVLVCDFEHFRLYNLENGETYNFTLQTLPDVAERRLKFLLGGETRDFGDADPINVRASELVADLHDQLKANNYTGHKLSVFLTRIVFCLFADDTGIFPEQDMFLEWLYDHTVEDGQHLGPALNKMFVELDTSPDQREGNLTEFYRKLPHVNGALFRETLKAPTFDRGMRLALIKACEFNWEPISPAIFGALFQGVMEDEERREKGAHYTEEEHILRVINPLFMDQLKARFKAHAALKNARESHRRLRALRQDMAEMNLFDPACGCGNFLVIAYREMRKLELDILKILHPRGPNQTLDAMAIELSIIDVDQFHGIEIDEFPVRIAETAMWMMDHLMNRELSDYYGRYLPRLPLEHKANIRHGDALAVDWADVISPDECSYILGNPPFRGATEMDEEQKLALSRVLQKAGSKTKVLDFVAGWFVKAVGYVTATDNTVPFAFVSTNSITQGQQVAQLWPLLLAEERGNMSIGFAHRTFQWSSEAPGKAHVHCTIVGLWPKSDMPPNLTLYDYPDIKGNPVKLSDMKVISPYLFDSSKLDEPERVIPGTRKAPPNMPATKYGSKPADGGGLILSTEEANMLRTDAVIGKYVRRLIGSEDFLNGNFRYCLWLNEALPSELQSNAFVRERLEHVRVMRGLSPKQQTKELANEPWNFAEIRQPSRDYIAIPLHSSERRQYVPFGFFTADDIVHNSCTCIPDGGPDTFALMTSAMHMTWMRYTCGRLESRYRYAGTLVYNTMPWPELNNNRRKRLEDSGKSILSERAKLLGRGQTLSQIYDPEFMPSGLRKAHKRNDKLVDSLYSRADFSSELKRIEYLFKQYEERVLPLMKKKKRRSA